jgi:3-oxoadipate enol-lactonase
MAETMVAVDGGEVWADDSGGDGPPLVLLHPGVGDSRIWEPLLPALTPSYRVLRYDARGFGRSPGIPGFAWPEESEPSELEAEYGRALEAGDVDAIAGLIQPIWGAAGSTPAVMEQFRSAARAYISSGDLMQEDPPALGRLGEITVPASLLVGDADYPPLIESNRQAAALIPGCQLTVVPGMDHLPPLRDPALVLTSITTTLSGASW